MAKIRHKPKDRFEIFKILRNIEESIYTYWFKGKHQVHPVFSQSTILYNGKQFKIRKNKLITIDTKRMP